MTPSLVEELAKVAGSSGTAEIILERAGFPRIFLPSNADHALDFWQKVCRMIENGIVSSGLDPVLAAAAEMFPGNAKLAPFRVGTPLKRVARSSAKPSAAANEEFDLFLSYRSADSDEVKRLAEALKARGVRPWFDLWQMPPGTPIVAELDRVLRDIPVYAVCVGQSGIGPWQALEVQAAIHMFVEKRRKVIPVLLPSAPSQVDWPFLLYMFSRARIDGSYRGAGLDDLIRTVIKK